MLERASGHPKRIPPSSGFRLAGRVLAIGAVACFLAASCSGGGQKVNGGGEQSPSGGDTNGSPAQTGSPSARGKFPLGEISILSGQSSCQGVPSCQIPYQVTCPDVQQPARGVLVVTTPAGSPRGLVTILLGGAGVGMTGVNRMFIAQLAQDGLEVVIVSWQDSWLESAPGEEVGPARLACRSATAIKWVHDNLYQQLGAPKAAKGACGFCLHGNSGGASQVGYALSLYGLGGIVDAAIMSGGPPHAALAKGCLQEGDFAYAGTAIRHIDLSYGFPRGGGPCERQDQSFQANWNRDSLESAGGTYKLTHTRIVFLFVSGDDTSGPAHGKVYLAKLQDAGSPYVTSQIITGTEHEIERLPQGRDALEQALLASLG